MNIFSQIKLSLKNLSSDPDVTQATRTAACHLSSAAGSPVFLICLIIMTKYSSYLEPIGNIHQTKVINLDEVHCHIENLLNILKTDGNENNAVSF